MPARSLIAEPFHVEAHLLGRPLASPGRRILAFVLDAALLILPTLATTIAAAALSLYVTDRPSFEAIRHAKDLKDKNPAVARAESRELAKLFVKIEAPGVPPAMALAVEEHDFDRAAEILDGMNVLVTLGPEEGPEQTLPPKTIRMETQRLIPGQIRAIALLGVPALYFAWFARSKRGATPGKRLTGIYLTRLDGEPLSWLEALERFVGLVHIPATLFISVLDLWRDPNRRLPHDRTVHTAVFRGRP